MKDEEVINVIKIVKSIDEEDEWKFIKGEIGIGDGRLEKMEREKIRKELDGEDIVEIEEKRMKDCELIEEEGKDKNEEEVGEVDKIKGMRDKGIKEEKVGEIGRKVERRKVEILEEWEEEERKKIGIVLNGRVIDRNIFIRRIVDGVEELK